VTKSRVLITARSFGKCSAEPAEYLIRQGYELVYAPGPLKADELGAVLPEFDAVIVGADEVTRQVLERAERLKVISMHGSGLDHIEVKTAQERGVAVRSVAGGNASAVADLTWGLILSVARAIPQADQSVKRGMWEVFIGTGVSGKTLGVIGMGSIGKQVILRAAGFQMRLLAFDPHFDAEFARDHSVSGSTLDAVLQQSDFVTVHVPLTPETRHLVNRDNLSQMKSSSYLVNMSRGEVVEQVALLDAVEDGRIAGAALDVLEEEPPEPGDPILKQRNIITTPHMGGRTAEVLNYLSMQAATNVVEELNKL
jgi:D-3-phosphoglycerate dehydrogenase